MEGESERERASESLRLATRRPGESSRQLIRKPGQILPNERREAQGEACERERKNTQTRAPIWAKAAAASSLVVLIVVRWAERMGKSKKKKKKKPQQFGRNWAKWCSAGRLVCVQLEDRVRPSRVVSRPAGQLLVCLLAARRSPLERGLVCPLGRLFGGRAFASFSLSIMMRRRAPS